MEVPRGTYGTFPTMIKDLEADIFLFLLMRAYVWVFVYHLDH